MASLEPTHKLDLLVTDVVMPGMDGRALAEQMLAAREGLRVVFVSGHTSDTVLRTGDNEQRVVFLQKPYSADQLVRLVRSTLDH